MKLTDDVGIVIRLAGQQRGVFSKADLQTTLSERHRGAFLRRVRALIAQGTLRRFCRGYYVAEPFDLLTLSQRIEPSSYISFGTVLAQKLLIGTSPVRQVTAAKVGRTRTYSAFGHQVEHLGIAAHLDFGHQMVDGIRMAEPEKAVLDVLYFHLRGRRYPFDIYSDIQFDKLDTRRLKRYLRRYRNPKFLVFARRVLHLA